MTTTTIRRASFDNVTIVVTFLADGTAEIGDRARIWRTVSARTASAVLADVAITTHAEMPAVIKSLAEVDGDRAARASLAAKRARRAENAARPRSRAHGHEQRRGVMCVCSGCLHTGVSSQAWR